MPLLAANRCMRTIGWTAQRGATRRDVSHSHRYGSLQIDSELRFVFNREQRPSDDKGCLMTASSTPITRSASVRSRSCRLSVGRSAPSKQLSGGSVSVIFLPWSQPQLLWQYLLLVATPASASRQNSVRRSIQRSAGRSLLKPQVTGMARMAL